MNGGRTDAGEVMAIAKLIEPALHQYPHTAFSGYRRRCRAP
jgi:hypothetical protein